MTDNTTLSPLVPDKHPQGELFLCDVTDAVLKDDMASMEHPVFSLSKKPDLLKKSYEHNGNTLEITPSIHGHATIYDKDVLIYAVSKVMKAKEDGLPYSRNVVFDAKDALIFMNRGVGGKDYRALEKSLTRLRGTTLVTNIVTGGEQVTDIFGLIERAKIHRKHKDGRVLAWGITLSDWLFNAVEANEVLTLHPDYFRLRKPIEKRIYELARKHCGLQENWQIGLTLLKKKTGSNSTLRILRKIVRGIEETDHLPDYSVSINDEDLVTFRNRKTIEAKAVVNATLRLSSDTYERARAAAPAWDIHYLETQWRDWMYKGGLEPPQNVDGAFIGFCRRWYERKGPPA